MGAISEELAHEIRNPLMAVGGFARRLKHKFPDLMEGEIILQESRRLENLLKRIVDYLRPKEFVCEECGAEEILMECLELLGPEIEERGICLQLDPAPDLPPAYADKDILAQAFTGLTLAMLEEMESGTTLLVTGFQNLGNVNIRFSAHTGSPAKGDVGQSSDAL